MTRKLEFLSGFMELTREFCENAALSTTIKIIKISVRKERRECRYGGMVSSIIVLSLTVEEQFFALGRDLFKHHIVS